MYILNAAELHGIRLLTATGNPFNSSDIWELLGQREFLATYYLIPGSDAFHAYGPCVVGVVFYSRKQRKEAPHSLPAEIKIDAAHHNMLPNKAKILKYAGIRPDEIARIAFIPWSPKSEVHETGGKKVPNVIEIPYEHNPARDPDNLFLNFMAMKLNDSYELIPFEREKFVGIILGRNDGQIDERLLSRLGYDRDAAEKSTNIQYYALITKQRRTSLNEQQSRALDDLKFIRAAEVLVAVGRELIESNIAPSESAAIEATLVEILKSAKKFIPSVLLIRRRPIYWDLASYLHIALRHLSVMQLGKFKAKSAFPYRVQDLELLIEKVLGNVRSEIDLHMETKPDEPFYRAGEMSIYFNGDYYALHVDAVGRLESFHIVADRAHQAP